MSISKLFATGLFSLCVSASAVAGLIGTTFDIAYHFPNSGAVYPFASFSPSTFTAGAGIDTIGDIEGVTFLDVDVLDTGLTVTFRTILSNPTWSAASFNGIILTASEPLGMLDLIAVNGTLSGFDASRVTIGDSQILLNWNGLGYVDGTVLHLSISDAPSQVPEPTSLALLGLGLAVLAATRRRATGGPRTRPDR